MRFLGHYSFCDSQFQLFTQESLDSHDSRDFCDSNNFQGSCYSMTRIFHLTWFPWSLGFHYEHGSVTPMISLESLYIHDSTDFCELACIPCFPVDHDLHNHFTTHDLHDSCKPTWVQGFPLLLWFTWATWFRLPFPLFVTIKFKFSITTVAPLPWLPLPWPNYSTNPVTLTFKLFLRPTYLWYPSTRPGFLWLSWLGMSTYSRTTRCSKTLLTWYVHLLEDYQVFY